MRFVPVVVYFAAVRVSRIDGQEYWGREYINITVNCVNLVFGMQTKFTGLRSLMPMHL